MGLTLRPDSHHPAGGHAILAGPGLGKVSMLSVENVFSSQFLGPDGKWGRLRHAFPVASARGETDALCLGPEIVDHILTDLMIALRDGGGTMLGRVVWPDTVAPRRDAGQGRASEAWVGEAAREPVVPLPPQPPAVQPEPGSVAPTTPEQVQKDQTESDDGEDTAPPLIPPSRRWLLPASLAAAIVMGGATWSLWPRRHDDPAPPPPQEEVAQRCAKTFDAKVAAAQDAPDSERVKLAEAAIGASCGAQAFQAVDGTRWETNEPAAWYQARFYDPNEAAPVFRDGHPADARAAFDYYARWADRSLRQAEALKKLCATHPDVVGDNAQRRRACAR